MDDRHDYEVAIDLMASGRVQVKQMVTHKYPLTQIQSAFDTAYQKKTGSIKVQIHS
jgi:L-iditol 2-dehydrogenase